MVASLFQGSSGPGSGVHPQADAPAAVKPEGLVAQVLRLERELEGLRQEQAVRTITYFSAKDPVGTSGSVVQDGWQSPQVSL
jgi:hypothetical protein